MLHLTQRKRLTFTQTLARLIIMKTTTHFTEIIKGIIADAYDARNIGEWHALFNW